MTESPFISYAQNLEDVMLWRVFGHREPGTYLDVGANSPNIDSVTLAFYERGWRGINIEPLEPWIGQLREARPEDVNLAVCASDQETDVELLDVEGTGLSTSDLSQRERLEQSFNVSTTVRPSLTLTSILKDHTFDRPFHFMKIDVEGMEGQVLAGCDLDVFRPWVILIESIEPENQAPVHEDWEALLTDRGYHFLYFDGLNRFYGADEHRSELAPCFTTPPNVFDNYVLRDHNFVRQHLAESLESLHAKQQEVTEVHLRLQDVLEQRTALERELTLAEQHIDQLYESTSWRITGPLRRLTDVARAGSTHVRSRYQSSKFSQ